MLPLIVWQGWETLAKLANMNHHISPRVSASC